MDGLLSIIIDAIRKRYRKAKEKQELNYTVPRYRAPIMGTQINHRRSNLYDQD